MSDETQERTQQMLRAQAWERAKGELHAMLHTFYGNADQCLALEAEINGFIQTVEGDGLHE